MSVETALVCVVASIIVKLVVPETDSVSARAIWASWVEGEALVIGPAHMPLEVLNGIRRSLLSSLLSAEEASEAVERVAGLPVLTFEAEQLGLPDLWSRFMESFDARVTPYDAAYLQVASPFGCELWTADDRLVRAVGEQLPWVRSLSEITESE